MSYVSRAELGVLPAIAAAFTGASSVVGSVLTARAMKESAKSEEEAAKTAALAQIRIAKLGARAQAEKSRQLGKWAPLLVVGGVAAVGLVAWAIYARRKKAS